MLKNEFLNFKDKLYLIKRILSEDYLAEKEFWKENLNADTILKKEGKLYFLETIVELEEIHEVELFPNINN